MITTKAQIGTTREHEIEQQALSVKTNAHQQRSFDSPQLVGLMFCMQFRKCLSEQDRILLNELAPPDRSVFLVDRGRFVHPEKFDTFPLEHIGGCSGVQAFFSHRFCPGGRPSGQASTIQTAVLNPGEPNSLLFGWFGPEVTTPEGSWDHRFSRVVADLRQAYSESAALFQRLQDQLKTKEPALIVDRPTGRLLWLNKSAAELCGQRRSDLIDLGFEQVRTMLSRNLNHRQLTMKRVSSGDFEVTLITVAEIKALTRPTGHFVPDSLTRTSQKKLAGIIMASDLLKSSLTDHEDIENVELIDIIAREARELDDLINTQMRSNPRKVLEKQ